LFSCNKGRGIWEKETKGGKTDSGVDIRHSFCPCFHLAASGIVVVVTPIVIVVVMPFVVVLAWWHHQVVRVQSLI